jgi:hypothetical protein
MSADEGTGTMCSRSRRHGEAQSPSKASGTREAGIVAQSALPILLGAVAVLGVGLWFGGLLPGSGSGSSGAPAASTQSTSNVSHSQALPSFLASAAPRVREAYAFAADHRAELAYIPCYCGCGQHSGHKSVRDCFIRSQAGSTIAFGDHGSGCDICVSIVLDVQSKLDAGESLTAVRSFIDGKYSEIGPGTDTPLPPGMEE